MGVVISINMSDVQMSVFVTVYPLCSHALALKGLNIPLFFRASEIGMTYGVGQSCCQGYDYSTLAHNEHMRSLQAATSSSNYCTWTCTTLYVTATTVSQTQSKTKHD